MKDYENKNQQKQVVDNNRNPRDIKQKAIEEVLMELVDQESIRFACEIIIKATQLHELKTSRVNHKLEMQRNLFTEDSDQQQSQNSFQINHKLQHINEQIQMQDTKLVQQVEESSSSSDIPIHQFSNHQMEDQSLSNSCQAYMNADIKSSQILDVTQEVAYQNQIQENKDSYQSLNQNQQIDETNLLDLLSLKSKTNVFVQSIDFKNDKSEKLSNYLENKNQNYYSVSQRVQAEQPINIEVYEKQKKRSQNSDYNQKQQIYSAKKLISQNIDTNIDQNPNEIDEDNKNEQRLNLTDKRKSSIKQPTRFQNSIHFIKLNRCDSQEIYSNDLSMKQKQIDAISCSSSINNRNFNRHFFGNKTLHQKNNNQIQAIKSPLAVSYAKINLAQHNTRLNRNINKDFRAEQLEDITKQRQVNNESQHKIQYKSEVNDIQRNKKHEGDLNSTLKIQNTGMNQSLQRLQAYNNKLADMKHKKQQQSQQIAPIVYNNLEMRTQKVRNTASNSISSIVIDGASRSKQLNLILSQNNYIKNNPILNKHLSESRFLADNKSDKKSDYSNKNILIKHNFQIQETNYTKYQQFQNDEKPNLIEQKLGNETYKHQIISKVSHEINFLFIMNQFQ